jgi:hypothetical protein
MGGTYAVPSIEYFWFASHNYLKNILYSVRADTDRTGNNRLLYH